MHMHSSVHSSERPAGVSLFQCMVPRRISCHSADRHGRHISVERPAMMDAQSCQLPAPAARPHAQHGTTLLSASIASPPYAPAFLVAYGKGLPSAPRSPVCRQHCFESVDRHNAGCSCCRTNLSCGCDSCSIIHYYLLIDTCVLVVLNV